MVVKDAAEKDLANGGVLAEPKTTSKPLLEGACKKNKMVLLSMGRGRSPRMIEGCGLGGRVDARGAQQGACKKN